MSKSLVLTKSTIKRIHFRELLCIYAFFIAQVTCLIRIAFILCVFFFIHESFECLGLALQLLFQSLTLPLISSIVHATSFKTLM